MRRFRWISPRRRLPSAFDLRGHGWRLADDTESGALDCVRLIDVPSLDGADPLPPAYRLRSLALGIADTQERAVWLARGFGEALAWDTGLDEIAARATRLLAPSWSGIRHHGRLTLDPAVRDAWVDGRRLRLFPREFALLWRLSDEPDATVARAELLLDVLGLTIEPGTNALAVHICRLRKKLHAAQLAHMLVTGPGDGSYALLFDADAPHTFGWRNALDDATFSGEDMILLEEAAE